MKSLRLIALLFIVLFFNFGIVLAADATRVSGTIYQGDISNGIKDSSVIVICHHYNPFGDLSIIAGNYGRNGCISPDWCEGADINKDGNVDYEDSGILSTEYGRTDCTESNSWCNGADINQDGKVNGVGSSQDFIKNALSGENGEYSVLFPVEECFYMDNLTVIAETEEGLSGSEDGSVDLQGSILDVGIVNVPLIPEFGLFIGGLTIISAVGIFFFVRRK